MKKTFSKEKLFDRTPRVFKRDATEVRFLLGGIGTGNFSVNSSCLLYTSDAADE